MKHYMLKLKKLDNIQFVKVLLLIALLVYILEHQLSLFAWELVGLLAELKNDILYINNAGNKLVGRTLTGIPPTSCDFGISRVYFTQTTENLNDIDNFACLVFPIDYSVLISLSHLFLATFIFHEKWKKIPATCPLAQSLYFAFCGH